MVYRFELRRNPKALLLPAIVLLILAGSLAVAVFLDPLLGVIAFVVAGLISYFLIKFFVTTIQSQITTSDDGMVCKTSIGSDTTIRWDQLTHAGWFHRPRGSRDLFVYAEREDRLLSMPDHYSDMEGLESEISSRLPLMNVEGDEDDELSDRLKDVLFPEDEIADDET